MNIIIVLEALIWIIKGWMIEVRTNKDLLVQRNFHAKKYFVGVCVCVNGLGWQEAGLSLCVLHVCKFVSHLTAKNLDDNHHPSS